MKHKNNLRDKTLENLERDIWDEMDSYPSALVERSHKLRKKVLRDFTAEDLRLMIGQCFSLDYLLPLSIEKLSVDLFAEGDFYPGDLLQAILNLNEGIWKANYDLWIAIKDLIKDNLTEISERGIQVDKFFSVWQ